MLSSAQRADLAATRQQRGQSFMAASVTHWE
jgi:hypothetical protein